MAKQELSNDFKSRVFQLKAQGLSSKDAMVKACDEHGVVFQTSWGLYPGSILHGWKGSLKKAAEGASGRRRTIVQVNDTTFEDSDGNRYTLVAVAKTEPEVAAEPEVAEVVEKPAKRARG